LPDWDDTDYSTLAVDYANVRRPDPRIGAQLVAALGSARTVLNVGAGTGSYEPTDRDVTAVEPSAEMRASRAAALPPAIDATADDLPFEDDAFDAALAVLTVHHWPDLEAGLTELRRVTRGPVVIMTADPGVIADLWVSEYSPEFLEVQRHRYPSLDRIADALGGRLAVRPLTIPLDCRDGFVDAFYGRPEALLEPGIRRAQSGWSFVDEDAQSAFAARLTDDLDLGVWDERFGHLRTQPDFVGSIRILVG
jgi:SAM-dependent methyltransferase